MPSARKTKAKYTGELKLCPCGNTFLAYRSFQRYCDENCRIKYSDARRSNYRKKVKKEKHCKECGKPFTTNLSRQLFCSDQCREEWYAKLGANKELRICAREECNNSFISSHPAKKFCSDECYSIAKRERRRKQIESN